MINTIGGRVTLYGSYFGYILKRANVKGITRFLHKITMCATFFTSTGERISIRRSTPRRKFANLSHTLIGWVLFASMRYIYRCSVPGTRSVPSGFCLLRPDGLVQMAYCLSTVPVPFQQ